MYWTRAALKSNAKMELRFSYWLSLAVCLVGGMLSGGASGFSSGYSSGRSSNLYDIDFSAYLPMLLTAFTFGLIIGFAFLIFVGGPMSVGMGQFFIRAPYGDRNFMHLFYAFNRERYMPIVKTMFFTNLYIWLWSLLFLIPGIYKSYQYRMVPYIVAENPLIHHDEAMRISREMTEGEKFNIWVLDLSFIGWYMLGSLALFIGTIFVVPYEQATNAQLYFALRQKYFDKRSGQGAQPQWQ